MHAADDTIIAVSSPPGRSLRGLVRLSGPRTQQIIDWLTHSQRGASPLPPQREMHACVVRVTLNPNARGGRTDVMIDGRAEANMAQLPAMLTLFHGPRSYTGQDLAELQVPGHPALLDALLSQCITLGARLAEPGEFTFRAFISGKLDLTQAEGVAATISATSDAQLHAAGLLRAGRLGTAANDLAQDVATQLALVEAGIDFVDQDDVVTVTPAALHAGLLRIVATLDDLLARSRSWGTVGALPRVVLWGLPSSGKSTLFNALLGRQRAVISPEPGTTRDALVETLRLDDAAGRTVEALLVDVAGLDEPLVCEESDAPHASLDELAQRAAGDAARNADLLLIIDDGRGVVRDVISESSAAQARLTVRTKRDLLTEPDVQYQVQTIAVSAVTGAGLSELKRAIAHTLSQRSVSLAGQTLALQPRHEAALRAARSHLASASSRVGPHAHERALREIELIAGDLRAALDELAALAGTMTPDDIIGRVFATFCVGK